MVMADEEYPNEDNCANKMAKVVWHNLAPTLREFSTDVSI